MAKYKKPTISNSDFKKLKDEILSSISDPIKSPILPDKVPAVNKDELKYCVDNLSQPLKAFFGKQRDEYADPESELVADQPNFDWLKDEMELVKIGAITEASANRDKKVLERDRLVKDIMAEYKGAPKENITDLYSMDPSKKEEITNLARMSEKRALKKAGYFSRNPGFDPNDVDAMIKADLGPLYEIAIKIGMERKNPGAMVINPENNPESVVNLLNKQADPMQGRNLVWNPAINDFE